MTNDTRPDTPPDWVLLEAAKRCKWHPDHDETYLGTTYRHNETFRALCDIIQQYEQPPVDRKLMCVNEAYEEDGSILWDDKSFDVAVRAIELWEEGFGCD